MGEPSLVHRLRNPPFVDRIHMADLHTEAADRIEALEARCERYREALGSVIREASMLLQNAEGCAANHYGNDIELHGEPQWITDCRQRIVDVRAALKEAGNGRS